MEDAQAGEQGVVEMEGGVFSGGADEDEGAVFDVGQEGVLLGFVEAVDFVDKEDGFAADGAFLLGLRHGFADFFDAGEDGGEADVARVEGVGEEQGKGGFAAAGRPPEEHGEGFFLRDGNGERHAVAEDVALADVVGEGFRAQAVGERGVAVAGKERGLAAHEVLWLVVGRLYIHLSAHGVCKWGGAGAHAYSGCFDLVGRGLPRRANQAVRCGGSRPTLRFTGQRGYSMYWSCRYANSSHPLPGFP